MKRLIAALLALMLALLTEVLAETGDTVTVSDVLFEQTGTGDARSADLSSLSLILIAGKPDGVPTIQAELYRDGSLKERAVAQFMNNTAYLDLDGLDRALACPLSSYGAAVQPVIDALFANTDDLINLRLPMFEGIAIPRVETTPLAALLGATIKTNAKGVRTAAFEVPYAQTRQLLDALLQYRDALPESEQPMLAKALELIDGLTAGDSGFALKGRAADKAKSSTLKVDIHAVRDGVTAEKPAATLKLTFARNKVKAGLTVYQGEYATDMASFTLTSKPKKATLEATLDVMGLLNASVSVRPVDGAQSVAVEAAALGKKYSAQLCCGQRKGGGYIDLDVQLSDRFSLSADAEMANDGSTRSDGAFAAVVQTFGEDETHCELRGSLIGNSGVEARFYPIGNPDEAVSVTDMSPTQREQLQQVMDKLVKRLSQYTDRG